MYTKDKLLIFGKRTGEHKMDYMQENKRTLDEFYTGFSAKSYTFFGAHPTEGGTHFALYAPHADSVSVTGDFNGWSKQANPLSLVDGVWYGFTENAKAGQAYKFAVTKNGKTVLKSDPYAFYSQLRPETASVIYDRKPYPFTDGEYWEKKRNQNPFKSPINIYEVHLGSFRQKEDGSFLNFREIVPYLTNYALEMSYNYIELMPICEHPLDASWGYQTTGYYSVTSRYGTPEDFQYFVDYLHRAGIGVIIDWVPGHFCRDEHGLYRFDGAPLYESENQMKADNPGWGTCNFDFTKAHVRSFLRSNADYFFSEFHIDGIRADAVANMLTFDFGKARCNALKNQYDGYDNVEAICFLRDLNAYLQKTYPGTITCAEDSSDRAGITKPPEIGGLGFSFKWNLGWMNDSIEYMKHDPIYRKSLHDKMTFPLFYAFNEHFILPLSHDEVVHGKCSMIEKMPGYRKDKFAQLKTYYLYMYGLPGKKLQFMGNEFGHALEWRFYEPLEWKLLQYAEYAGMKSFSAALNHLYVSEPAFWEQDTGWDGFGWCNANDRDNSVFSFVRYGKDRKDALVFVMNLTPMPHENYPLGVPFFTEYREILNTDSTLYGGDNRLNRAFLIPKTEAEGEMPYRITVNLPPFGGMIYKPFDASGKTK